MRRLMAVTIATAMLASISGCGTLVSPSTLVSMATSVFGGYANGAVMGGSVVGVIHDKATDAGASTETAANPEGGKAVAQPQPSVADSR